MAVMKKHSDESAWVQYNNLTKDRKRKNRAHLFSYIKKHKVLFSMIFIVTLAVVAQAALTPWFMQMIIDNYLVVNNRAFGAVISLLVGIASFGVIKILCNFVSTYFLRSFQLAIEMDAKHELFNKTQKLNITFFDKVNEGYLISRMTNDTVQIGEYARMIPENVFNVTLSLGVNMAFIFSYSWIVGASAIVFLAVLITFGIMTRKRFIASWKKIHDKRDAFNSFFVNSVSGIRETKAYVNENYEKEKFNVVANEFQGVWKWNFKMYSTWTTLNVAVMTLMTVGVFSIGVWQYYEGNLTIGGLTALNTYVGLIIEPVNKILATFDLIIRGSVSLNRVVAILEETEENYTGEKIDISKGEIEFKDVHLKYQESIKALNGISFKVKPGEKVAFVGHTGSGKSTILKSIVKFYEPTAGQIIIDGKDISNVDVASLRSQVTIMNQEPYLFFDTVRSNILFGKQIDEDTYQNTIQQVDAAEFINKLPSQHETNVGPRGVTLSGGQKQRVALARAILKDSKIILFDESTSALDNATEKNVKKAISKLTKDKTVIYIAHRLTTIQDVDRIFVVENGEIIEEGSHNQLMKKEGKYFNLVKSSENNVL